MATTADQLESALFVCMVGGWFEGEEYDPEHPLLVVVAAEAEHTQNQFAELEAALPFITFGADGELTPVIANDLATARRSLRAMLAIGWLEPAPEGAIVDPGLAP